MDNQQIPKADSQFQKIARKNHRKWKLRLLSKGGQKADSGGSPYSKKPDYNRAKSAPPGFGGSIEESEQLDEVIRKKGGKYCLFSKKTKRNLGCYPTKAGAMKRERQVQYFKHLKESIIQEELERALLDEGWLDDLKSLGTSAWEKIKSVFSGEEDKKEKPKETAAVQEKPQKSPASFKNDPEFEKELNRISQKFGINPKDLLGVMQSESGVNPQARNRSGATGLIQFMPSTARQLGTTVEELYTMNRAEQMKYVEKFFDKMKLKYGATGGEIYATIFLPGRRGRGVLTSQGEGYYNSNKGLDLDKDGDIDIADLDARINKKKQQMGLAENRKITIKFGEVLEEGKKKKKGKEDRCVRIAKSKYDAWPSAYASGAVVKCRQGKIWKNIKEEEELEETKKLSKAKHLAKKGVALAAAASTMLGAKDQEKLQKSKKAKTEKHVVAEEELDEEWSEKYKKSIDCKNPKGFSQRAHCQGRKKRD